MTEGERWSIKLTGPAERALRETLPPAIAWAAYTFITERLAVSPHRLGAALRATLEGSYSAHLGTYRVIYKIDEEAHCVIVTSIRLRGDVYGIR